MFLYRRRTSFNCLSLVAEDDKSLRDLGLPPIYALTHYAITLERPSPVVTYTHINTSEASLSPRDNVNGKIL
jgi:hypothetical protein